MFRSGISRAIASATVAVGALAGVGGLVIAGATPAYAGPGCSPAPLVCITPNTGLVQHQIVKVVVKGPASTEIAVTECNSNVTMGDANACNQNPSMLNKAGGPMLAATDANGRAVLHYKVLVSATKAVGDGLCTPGGDTCFLIAASVSSMMPVANPSPFTTA
jgi:hypothetical protein